jgi:hypothetical protein
MSSSMCAYRVCVLVVLLVAATTDREYRGDKAIAGVFAFVGILAVLRATTEDEK